jgi:hypothetical protein
VVASICAMSFSDLLALTNELSEPEPEPAPSPPPNLKDELDGQKASLNELKLVQEQQGIQVAQLLEAMTALARHAVRTPLRANSYFEPLWFDCSGATYGAKC